MSLKRLHQIFIGQEPTEATQFDNSTTPLSLFVAGKGSYLVIDPQIAYDVPRFARNINRSSLTQLQGLSGIKSGSMQFGLELTGTNSAFGTSAATVPQFGLPLRACGFRQEPVMRFTIGAITGGPFRHGEIVTQTGSAATGTVVQDTYTGQTSIWIAPGVSASGTEDLGNGTAFTPTGLLTGASSGATATPTGFQTTLTVGAITGTFVVGETVSQATSTATGVITSIDLTNSRIYVRQTSVADFNNANVVTGGTSAATTTPSQHSSLSGYGWWPQSYALSYLRTTGAGVGTAIAEGDLLKSRTSGGVQNGLFQAYRAYGTSVVTTLIRVRRVNGHSAASDVIDNVTQSATGIATLAAAAQEGQIEIPSLSLGIAKDGVRESIQFSRGTVSLTGTIGEPMIMNFDFKGGFDRLTDQGNVSGVSFAQTVPPVLIDADLGLGHAADLFSAEYVPCIRTITLAMANDIAFIECMANASGIENTLITGRKPTGSIDPDLQPESVFSVMTDFLNNVSCRARFTVGSTLGNKFLMTMPAISTTAAPTGDRNGISTRQVSFEMTGGSQTISALNVENELVIVAQFA